MPNTIAVIEESAIANASTRASIRASVIGISMPENHRVKFFPQTASIVPAAPPATASSDALGEHLPHDAPPTRAERESDRHLAAPRRGTHEEQVCQVDAADQQHGADDGEDDREGQLCVQQFAVGPRPPGPTRSRGIPHRPGFGVSGRRAAQLSRTLS